MFPLQTPSVKTSLHYIVFSEKKKKMGMVNNIRVLMMVVSMAICLTSVVIVFQRKFLIALVVIVAKGSASAHLVK